MFNIAFGSLNFRAMMNVVIKYVEPGHTNRAMNTGYTKLR
jgi:hypothetical protein